MSLLDVVVLPELWEQIAHRLPQNDLAHLSLVSKTLHTLTEVHLYRSISWTWSHSPPGCSGRLDQLLRNLLQRPQLAKHIRELTVVETGYGEKPFLLTYEPLTEQERSTALDLIQAVDLKDSPKWMQLLRDFEVETTIALILLQAHNIEKLTVDMFHRHTGMIETHMSWRPIGEILRLKLEDKPKTDLIPQFERLTDFSCPSIGFDCHDELMRRGEVYDMLSVFCTPRLRSASLKLSQPKDAQELSAIDLWLKLPTWSTKALTSLHLQHTTVPEWFLARLISDMENLEVFHLSLYRDYEATGYNGALIGEALKSCRSKLRRLHIGWEYGSHEGIDLETQQDKPLGSLKDFDRLEDISASFAALVGNGYRLTDVLPSNLKTLDIKASPEFVFRPWEHEMGQELEGFFPHCRLHIPHLQEVLIGFMDDRAAIETGFDEALRHKYNVDESIQVSLYEIA